jgi:SAM-dependent methyltransferase
VSAAARPVPFTCLWCGRGHTPRSPDDLEAWTRLCPECLGRAQDNAFLRTRLRAGIEARARAAKDAAAAVPATPASPHSPDLPGLPDVDAEMVRYYAARAGEYDDWYLRRGRYSHGPIDDMAWQADLDAASLWLDALPFRGDIVELAAGTGWWSPLLASKGTLWLYDAAEVTLDRARDRLVAHGLRAHLHVRDAWAEPDRQVDGLFAGFWLSHVDRDRLAAFLELAFRWLRPGGLVAFIDSRPDPASGARDHDPPAGDIQLRRLADGSEYRVRKVHYAPPELREALERAGFESPEVRTTARFFVLASARRPAP